MWGPARTATSTREAGPGASLIAGDHDSAAWGGLHAAQPGTRCDALAPMRPGGRTACGACGQDSAQGLRLRHEHGRQYRAQVWQEALTFLGSTRAPACVRAPAGNGGAERCLRTRKEQRFWLTTFETVAALRLARHAFQRPDKETWLIGRPGSKAPAQGRQEQRCAWAEAA